MALGHFATAMAGSLVAALGFTVAARGPMVGVAAYFLVLLFLSPLLKHTFQEVSGTCNHHHIALPSGQKGFRGTWALILLSLRLSIDGFVLGIASGGRYIHHHTSLELELRDRADLWLTLFVNAAVACCIGIFVILTALLVRALRERFSEISDLLPRVAFCSILHFVAQLAWKGAASIEPRLSLKSWSVVLLLTTLCFVVLSIVSRMFRASRVSSLLPSSILVVVIGAITFALWQLLVIRLAIDPHEANDGFFWGTLFVASAVFFALGTTKQVRVIDHS